MPEIRAFNKFGIDEFVTYLTRLKDDTTLDPPLGLLTDYRYADKLEGGAKVQLREFDSKFDFGGYINSAFRNLVPERVLRTSVGLWAWLAMFYIDQTCPKDGHGRRRVLRLEKYIPSASHIATGLDKHLLFFPWKMVSLHGNDAAWLLSGALREDTKVMRELANSYRRNVSPPFVKLAKLLYFDPQEGKLRMGATSTNRKGNLRRLDRVVNQLDLTYDVFGIEAGRLAKLLPRSEFKAWLPAD